MPDLKPLLDALDDRRSEFLAAFESITPDQLAVSPGGEAWSPLQIGEHVMRVEEGLAHVTSRQIEKGAARRDVGEPSERSVAGLIAVLRTPAKLNVPEGVPSVLPTGEIDLATLRQRWLEAGERWRAIVATFPPELAETALAYHDVAGAMTASQTLRMLEAHVEHHMHQLARTVQALNPDATRPPSL